MVFQERRREELLPIAAAGSHPLLLENGVKDGFERVSVFSDLER